MKMETKLMKKGKRYLGYKKCLARNELARRKSVFLKRTSLILKMKSDNYN